uniref:Uncharacterized protein n=1 Tax=Heterorhabditis bacteriophora TaxID=37862 RepID=A0A1I7WD33_HETBA
MYIRRPLFAWNGILHCFTHINYSLRGITCFIYFSNTNEYFPRLFVISTLYIYTLVKSMIGVVINSHEDLTYSLLFIQRLVHRTRSLIIISFCRYIKIVMSGNQIQVPVIVHSPPKDINHEIHKTFRCIYACGIGIGVLALLCLYYTFVTVRDKARHTN